MQAAEDVREKLQELGKTPVLVGMMGAGKTTVGKHLAALLAVDFKDLDDVIVAREGRNIPDIFAQDGEEGFRQIECRTISSLFEEVGVLGVGGGAFVEEGTRAVIQKRGLSVWLRGEPGALYDRIQGDKNRPKLQDFASFSALCRKRYPVYAQAHMAVETIGKEPQEVAREVIMALHTHLKL